MDQQQAVAARPADVARPDAQLVAQLVVWRYRERTCKEVSSSGRVNSKRISFLDSAVDHSYLCILSAIFP